MGQDRLVGVCFGVIGLTEEELVSLGPQQPLSYTALEDLPGCGVCEVRGSFLPLKGWGL